MATKDSGSQSSDLTVVNSKLVSPPQQRLNELARALLEFKLTSEQKSEKTRNLLQRLQRQVFLLESGFMLTLLVLGGGLAGVSSLLKSDQVQLTEAVNEIAQQGEPGSSLINRLGTLESQAQRLGDKIPQGLPLTLETTQTELERLLKTVETLEQTLDQQGATTAILVDTLQNLVGNPSVGAPSESESQEESTLSPADQSSEGQPETTPVETAN